MFLAMCDHCKTPIFMPSIWGVESNGKLFHPTCRMIILEKDIIKFMNATVIDGEYEIIKEEIIISGKTRPETAPQTS